MSNLFEAVQCSSVAESHRIDPHLFCRTLLAATPFWFRVTDDGWYGWFVAQYPQVFDGKRLDGVSMLNRLAGQQSSMFRFEIADDTGIVRAVFQLPIASEPRITDDVHAAVHELADQWGRLLPFLDRIHGGEDMEKVAVDALAAFQAADGRQDRKLVMPAACVGG